jgi:hypothetical protein
MQATVVQTCLDAVKGSVEETRPGAGLQVNLRPQCVDRSECSTSICSVVQEQHRQLLFRKI